MRTTIRIDDGLLAQAKRLAIRTHRTLTAVIEDALREMLTRSQKKRGSAPVHLHTFSGKGLRSGVDLDDSAALMDLMDTAHDSD